MSIGIEGSFLFQFTLGKNKDFIQERDLVEFTLIEEAGNSLPTFRLSFNTNDESILPLLNEANLLQVSFGKDNTELETAGLSVTGLNTANIGESLKLITVTGIYDAMKFITTNKINITTSTSGIEAMIAAAKPYFKVDSNVVKSSDRQKWVQYNISDRAFINNTWLHSDIPNSFIGIGITSSGRFIIKDIKKDLREDYKWRLTSSIKDEKRDIVVDSDPAVDIKTGLINSWTGYGREMNVYDLDTAVDTPTLEKATPILALTSKLAKRSDIDKRFASVGIQNENTHPNYWKAYLRNLTHLSSFHNVSVFVSFHNLFKSIKVLDLVMYRTEKTGSGFQSSSEYLSGLYYVTKVARTVSNKQLVTTLKLSRESLNSIK